MILASERSQPRDLKLQKCQRGMAGTTGLEPAASAVTVHQLTFTSAS